MAAFLFLFSSSVRAQVTGSAISGRVTDAQNHPLGEATIIAVHKPTGSVYRASSNDDGKFVLPNLRSGGPYQIVFRRIGFKPATRTGIVLSLGNTTPLAVSMGESVTALASMTITGEKDATISTGRTGPATNVDHTLLEALPSLSRSLQDFTRLTPQGSANSFGGSNFRYNNVTIDGAANNDAFGFSASPGGVSGVGPSGTPGSQARTQPISLDAVQEVQVVLAPFDVKLGNVTGGSINAVTRTGTNTVLGSLYSFGRNQLTTGLSADGDRTRLPSYKDYQYGGRIGGPLKKDKAFYFLNLDFARRTEPLQFAPGDPSTAVSASVARALSDTLRNRFGFDAGSYDVYSNETKNAKVFVRLDFNLGDNEKLNIRHNFVNGRAGNLDRGSFLVKYGSQDYTFYNRTNSTVAELKSTFGSKASNSLIVGFSDIRDHRAFPGTIFPQLEINGPSGSLIFAGTDREAAIYKMNQQTLELTDNLVLYRGNHTVTLGTHNEFYGINYFFLNAWNGRWQYNSISDFNANKPSRIRGTYSLTDNSYAAVSTSPSADFRVLMPSAYVQDEIAITDRFRVTPGIRVDVPTFPDRIPVNPRVAGNPKFSQYRNDFGGQPILAPRVAFNWDARGDQSVQVRGGSGIFSGRVPFAWFAYGYYNTGLRYGNVDLRPSASSSVVPLVTDPSKLRDLQGGLYEVNLIDNNFKMAQVARSSLAADFRLPAGITASLEGMFTKTINDVKFVNIGLKDSTTAALDGRPVYLGSPVDLRVDPAFTSVFLLTNTHKGSRYSLTGQLRKSSPTGIDAMVAYTYAQSHDVSNGIRNSPQSNWEFNQSSRPNEEQLSFSNFDLRHRIIANISYKKQFNEQLTTSVSAIYAGGSGNPFTYVYVGDYNRDGSSSNDLIYVPKDFADARIVVAPGDSRSAQQIWNQLDAFIQSQPYLNSKRGSLAERNGARTPWNHQIDVRVAQDIGLSRGEKPHAVQATLDIVNFGAILGRNFGKQYFVPNAQNANYPLMRVTQRDSRGIPTGFSFDPVPNNTPWQYDALNSRYQAQLGLRYSF